MAHPLLLSSALVSSLLGAAPGLSPELPLEDALPAPGPYRAGTSVAANDSRWLAVWEGSSRLMGTFVGPDGSVSSAEAFPIAATLKDRLAPAVASDGRDFLVAWGESLSLDLVPSEIRAARVSAEGEVLDPEGIVLIGNIPRVAPVAVASNGASYLVVWMEGHAWTKVSAALVSESSGGLEVTPIALPSRTGGRSLPAVASAEGDFLLAWTDEGDASASTSARLMAARVTATGLVLDPDGVVIPGTPKWGTAPALASDGTRFLLTWMDASQIATDDELRMASVEASMLGTLPISSTQLRSTFDLGAAAVAWTGEDYLATWLRAPSRSKTVLEHARISSGGILLGAPTEVPAPGARAPTVSVLGPQALVIHATDTEGPPLSRTLDGLQVELGSGAFTPVPLVARQPNAQSGLALAWTGTGTLALWLDSRGSAPSLRTLRLDAGGLPEGEPSSMLAVVKVTDPLPTALVWGRETGLALWNASRTLHRQAVDAEGRALGPPAVLASELVSQGPVAADFAETHFLVAWSTKLDADPWNRVHALRLTSTGDAIDSAPLALTAGVAPVYAVTRTRGETFLVASAVRTGSTSLLEVHRVGAEGAAAATLPLELESELASLRLSWDGRSVVAAWTSGVKLGMEPALWTWVLDADGRPLQPAPQRIVSGVPLTREELALAWDGAHHVLTFGVRDEEGETRLVGLRLRPDGVPEDATPWVLADGLPSAGSPVLTATREGELVAGFVRTARQLTSSTSRAAVRRLQNFDTFHGHSRWFRTHQDRALELLLEGVMVDGEDPTFIVDSVPTHGTLSGTPPALVYTPHTGFLGTDSFRFRVLLGDVLSPPATISIWVAEAPAAPSPDAGVEEPSDTPHPALGCHGCAAQGAATGGGWLILAALIRRRRGARA